MDYLGKEAYLAFVSKNWAPVSSPLEIVPIGVCFLLIGFVLYRSLRR